MKARHFQLKVHRSGVAAVEAAVVLSVFLVVLLGSLDLGLAVLKNNTLAEAARRLARAAIVRGSSSSSIHTVWGPTTYNGTANDGSQYAKVVNGVLVAVNSADVKLRLEWPDGGNDSGNRVSATVTTTYQPMIASIFGSSPYTLHASSTMRIEH